MAIAGFYKRILPCPPAVEFASRQGKELFHEALHNGTMEGFFKIISYFQTQSEPAFCGLASLSIVLNALSIDPGRKWKGPWRWFDETMLDCCEPLEKVKVDGITFGKLVCLANCAGASVETFRANQTSLQKFRSSLASCASSEDCHIIVSYHRSPFKQTGTGHFSPIGGYHAGKDMVLILDVARFKYPPHWVPLPLLWEAMHTKDEMTQQYRGYMLVTRRGLGPSLIYTLSCKQESWKRTSQYLVEQVPQLLEKDNIDTIDKVLSTIMSSFPADPSEFIKWIAEIKVAENSEGEVPKEDVQRRAIQKEMLQQIRGTQIYSHVSSYLSTTQCCCGSTCIKGDPAANVDQTCPESRDLLSVLILGLPSETWEKLQSEDVKRAVYNLVCLDNLQCALKEEVLHIRCQLTYLYLCSTGKLDKEFQDPSIDLDAN